MGLNFNLKRAFPPGLKVLIILLTLGIGLTILSFPVRSYQHDPGSNPDQDGFQGFSGEETAPGSGLKYVWALKGASILYPRVPRYTPLTFNIRLNFQRPPEVPLARVEIYEKPVEPETQPKLITTLELNPAGLGSAGPREFEFTVPARPAGKGLLLEFRSNTFKVPGDPRNLGFIFYNSELKIPRGHILNLIWPYPYWPAGFLLLGIIIAWGLISGLTTFETGLLGGLTALVLVTTAPSTYQQSWWLLLVSFSLGLLFLFVRFKRPEATWPIFATIGLVLVFFLFSSDQYLADLSFYTGWSHSIHQFGVWNIYNNDPRLNYLPLVVYLLWVYNLVIYPLGLQESYLAWRIFASSLYLVTIGLIFLTVRTGLEKNSGVKPHKIIILVGLNAAFFFNPAIWGQSDIFAVLALALTLYLANSGWIFWGGLAFGLAAISKPQAWFALPVLALLLLQKGGKIKSFQSLALGFILAGTLSGIAFGFDPASVVNYFQNPEFAGDYDNKYPTTFNLSYLILGADRVAPPGWLSGLGFGIVGLVLLILVYLSLRKKQTLLNYCLGGAWLVISCFAWLIKMKERYLIFAFPFLGISALKEPKFYKVFLALSWLQLLQLLIGLYEYSPLKTFTLSDQPFLWSYLLGLTPVRQLLALSSLALSIYTGYLFIHQARKKSTEPSLTLKLASYRPEGQPKIPFKGREGEKDNSGS